MSLELPKNGATWRAVFYVGSTGTKRKKSISLNIAIEGRRPVGRHDLGDELFQRSKAKAQVAHDALLAQVKAPADAIAAADRAVELATNRQVRTISLFDVQNIWQDSHRGGKVLSRDTVRNYKTYFAHFFAFMKKTHPAITDIRMVDSAIVAQWVKKLNDDGIRFATFNKYVSALSSAFSSAALAGNVKSNPFKLIKRVSKTDVAHRKPFSSDEITRILDATPSDPFVGPIVVVAVCTAMRRRDCVLLEWSSIDLEQNFICVRANKTNERLQIPILPRLRTVLEERPRNCRYVFPEAAALFLAEKDNRNHFLLRLKKLLAAAGIDYDARNAFRSSYRRQRKASLSGWHAFKTTFCTMALDAGMTEALLKKVVGNQVVDIVLENYYQPSRERLTTALLTALPAAITGDKAPGKESVPALLAQMNEENWRDIRERLLRSMK